MIGPVWGITGAEVHIAVVWDTGVHEAVVQVSYVYAGVKVPVINASQVQTAGVY